LKKNTSLSAVQKVEQLRQIGRSLDEKITPMLNAEQQKKFQEMREQMRRHLIETLMETEADEALHKLEAKAKGKL